MKNYPRNYVQDPGFEMGPDTPYWKQSSEGGHQLIVCDEAYAHSGRCLAWLGGWDNQNDELWQDIQNITVPSGCISGRLTLYYKFRRAALTSTEDDFSVYIRVSAGDTITDVAKMDYTDVTDNYELLSHDFSASDLRAIEAKGNIQLYFQMITNEVAAGFRIDDIVLTLCQ